MNISKKFARDGQNASNSEVELFIDKETNGLTYKTEYGIPVELATKKDVAASTLYKSYTVSLQQSTIDPPVVLIEFENTLKVSATYTVISAGEYLVTFDKNIFTGQYQDYVTISQLPYVDPATGGLFAVYALPVFNNALAITSYFNGGINGDVIGQMAPTSATSCILDIRVYNQ